MGNEQTGCCSASEETQQRNNMQPEDVLKARRMGRTPAHEHGFLPESSTGYAGTNDDVKTSAVTEQAKEARRKPVNLETRDETVLPDGGKYTGEWNGDKKHGNGKLVYTDGAVYEGESGLTSRIVRRRRTRRFGNHHPREWRRLQGFLPQRKSPRKRDL